MGVWRHPLSTGARHLSGVPVDGAMATRLRESFEALGPRADTIAHLFYERLFESRPDFRAMFPADLSGQRQKLVRSLESVVRALDEPHLARAQLLHLGRKHAGYGVRPEHYPPVRGALLDAMARAAGAGWTPEVARDWTVALELISDIMIEGGNSAPGGAGVSAPRGGR